MENPAKNQTEFTLREYKIFVVLSAVMITSYLTANIMAVKLISIFGITMFDAGTITFPVSYLLGDVITEVYGFKNAKRLIILTFFCSIFLAAATYAGLLLPSPEFAAETAEAYSVVFSFVPRILFASLTAFLAGELINAWTMEKIKKRTGEKRLWLRTVGSSAFGYLADTVLFVFIAFTAPLKDLLTMTAAQYLLKMILEALCATPVSYILIRWIKKEPR